MHSASPHPTSKRENSVCYALWPLSDVWTSPHSWVQLRTAVGGPAPPSPAGLWSERVDTPSTAAFRPRGGRAGPPACLELRKVEGGEGEQDASKTGTMGTRQPIGQLRPRRTAAYSGPQSHRPIHTHACTHIHACTHTYTELYTQVHTCAPTHRYTPTCTHNGRVLLVAPPRRDAQRSPGHRERGEPPPSQLLTRLHGGHPANRPGRRPQPEGLTGKARPPCGQLQGRPPAPGPGANAHQGAHGLLSPAAWPLSALQPDSRGFMSRTETTVKGNDHERQAGQLPTGCSTAKPR